MRVSVRNYASEPLTDIFDAYERGFIYFWPYGEGQPGTAVMFDPDGWKGGSGQYLADEAIIICDFVGTVIETQADRQLYLESIII